MNDFPEPRTLAYRRLGGKVERNEVFDYEAFHGGSNVYISARDLHRWNASFFGRPLIDEPIEFATVGEATSGLTLGNWYRSQDGVALWYSGHLQGFHNEVFRDMRARRSIVYVSNNTIAPWMQKGVVEALNAILDGRRPQLAPPATDAVPKNNWESLAGRWLMPDGETLTIEYDAGRLKIRARDLSYEMFPEGGLRAFYVPGLDYIIGFARGADRSFSRIYISSNLGARWGTRQ